MNIKFLKENIKLHMADPSYRRLKKRIKSHTKKTFFIIGGPVHGNLGDHAIMEEEKCFVNDFFPEYECEEILMPFFNTQKVLLKKHDFPVKSPRRQTSHPPNGIRPLQTMDFFAQSPSNTPLFTSYSGKKGRLRPLTPLMAE